MFNYIKKRIKSILERLINAKNNDEELLILGKILSNQQYLLNFKKINDYEFKIFSQFGDDGIIQYLIKKIKIENKTFIEFGVADYLESNTRFLLMNNNWSGYVIDGSIDHINRLKSTKWYWQYDLRANALFLDTKNLNQEIEKTGFINLGLLHIDLDGNDYWMWESLNTEKIKPCIVILEYNSVFGKDRSITTPYDPKFVRSQKHYSNLYWGASLKALATLSKKKNYEFVGCNTAGNNAYFIRKDLITEEIRPVSIEDGFIESKFRESRSPEKKLTYLRGNERSDQIRGLIIYNTEAQKEEKI
ncbi:NADH dehydrogenase [Candidatus Falkowbacteria bacterium RIFOXYB2_FULL_34_18]|uniref:NADH dehydrogenase n=1 Tax=Candidatus Falkowbacteria bacterium RIFOXYD2_FULL_34_120 TaxID=1798007 RepID=A0A1F5TRX3_9BACT|nr:MAG: NADH dehydrogenase [Candidatus Falkowbacteria bacterium RIFOXYB2_FULL_34_18]OGF29664.1 MAG: NADH dehydrogenase [Candidatus Falkowbacteria bacterium RIFOXYC12_FULL_34_55]OGF37391.1 MAG: NADH dehydrogenase [Candidatus Falkowbacteria bacterium RIFOXYC2_FULL_34_220]OGF39129.1 MAG: NADH dehydrogenase [Candidatus Falkowbacteria bacterium RIFOXYD12_FULL_34_57]OGF41653.1 MAG: NADH dehydrogenase [Candidatus Falkowbacteria bacterium RIFOXYD2_FULL_34_120]